MMSLMLMLTVLQSCCTTYAYAGSHNTKTGYDLIIDDSAGYFSEDEMASLKELMGQITQYCNGPSADGTIFVIDRDLNEIYLYTNGRVRSTITDSRAYSITDNTYIYATASKDYDYYTCSYKTFEQVLTLMEGRRIAEPMKYICSALLAIIAALLINYFIVMFMSRSRKANIREILSGTYANVRVNNPGVEFTNQTKRYSPQSSGSSGGGGHSGGGGGGGSHGGGGGHSI